MIACTFLIFIAIRQWQRQRWWGGKVVLYPTAPDGSCIIGRIAADDCGFLFIFYRRPLTTTATQRQGCPCTLPPPMWVILLAATRSMIMIAFFYCCPLTTTSRRRRGHPRTQPPLTRVFSIRCCDVHFSFFIAIRQWRQQRQRGGKVVLHPTAPNGCHSIGRGAVDWLQVFLFFIAAYWRQRRRRGEVVLVPCHPQRASYYQARRGWQLPYFLLFIAVRWLQQQCAGKVICFIPVASSLWWQHSFFIFMSIAIGLLYQKRLGVGDFFFVPCLFIFVLLPSNNEKEARLSPQRFQWQRAPFSFFIVTQQGRQGGGGKVVLVPRCHRHVLYYQLWQSQWQRPFLNFLLLPIEHCIIVRSALYYCWKGNLWQCAFFIFYCYPLTTKATLRQGRPCTLPRILCIWLREFLF